MVFSSPDFDAHEVVHAFCDADARLKGFIAIHSTARGPAFGGCRMWPYGDEASALRDVLRLSQGMSYKNAMAGLAYGGGKAVIMADPRGEKTPQLFKAFGRVVDGLGGAYITAEDVGVGVDDMRMIAAETQYVSGIPQPNGHRGGDPSPHTARGVFEGMKAAAEHVFGSPDLAGRVVAVQGVGSVGYHLCVCLHEAGARLKIADLHQASVERAVAEFEAEAVAPDAIVSCDADIFAPCALGGVLTRDSIDTLTVKIVAGAANNQLASAAEGDCLQRRGIIYAPDYVINAGGIISVAAERDPDATADSVTSQILAIGPRTADILGQSQASGRPPHEVADELARELIREAGQSAPA